MHEVKRKVLQTIDKYRMISKKDKVLVAVSGGKDSTSLLQILHEAFPLQIEAITINPHIPESSEENINNINGFCKERGIILHIISMRSLIGRTLKEFKDELEMKGHLYSYCTLCGILKRHYLNKFAKDLGATKVATGHNIDDISQSILMNYLRGSPSMSGKLTPMSGTFRDKSFVRRIKPLYFIREEEMRMYSKEMGFKVIYDPCPYSEDAYRRELRKAMKILLTKEPDARENIVASLLSIAGKMKKEGAPDSCRYCNSPSATDVCSACGIIRKL